MTWLIIFSAFLLPGLTIASLCNYRNFALLLAPSLGLSLYTFLFVVLQLGGSSENLLAVYLVFSAGFIVVALACKYSRECLFYGIKQFVYFTPVLIVVFLYHRSVGAFVDHGADIYQHMVLVQAALTNINANNGELLFEFKLGTKNYVFHNIAGILISTLKISAQKSIEVLSISFSAIWTLTVFCTSQIILRQIGVRNSLLYVTTVLAVFFYWTAFGINNFSFARYYIGGPAILTFGMYLGCLIIFIDQIKNPLSVVSAFVVTVFLATLLILHPQEAILFVVYALSIASTIIGYYVFKKSDINDLPIDGYSMIKALVVLFAVLVGLTTAILLLPKYRFDPIPLRNLGILSEKLINWNILRPTHQFYTVLGLWGLLRLCSSNTKHFCY